ncbi:uncharacterized protein LOC116842584 isoform X2 [Odontomachus brunneus]|uniref:uncharacterized protein LOC116842584 isoform X2 n=1 Tax=Odontomachus brunneus TaxID=486640 RepID=UPI0013F2832A|nr:uncharacterized protein LOC116842584 isoform X2 [Odontomachus brunneus]
MPSCCVRKCSNSSKKGFSMHRFPQNMERKKQWIANIAEMWEKPRSDGKKKLKEIAVPTIFLDNGCSQNKNGATSVRANDIGSASLHTEDHITNINNINNENFTCNSIDNVIESTTDNINDIEKIMEQSKEMKLKLQQANLIINKLDKSKRMLIKRVKRLMYSNRKLTEENHILKNIKNNKKILNDDQIKVLHKQSARGCKWSNATIRKALKLKLSCGNGGYEELLNQGIPLPAQRTLRRKSVLIFSLAFVNKYLTS